MIRLPDWLDPWSANRRLRDDVALLENRLRIREDTITRLDHAVQQSSERYDRIRDTCAALREALDMWRREYVDLRDRAVLLSAERNRLQAQIDKETD